jgi:4-amino-4-deoxy-L-arabinose transferase-like glycosyltransferase
MTGILFILVSLPFIIIRGFSVQLSSTFIKRTSGVLHSLHPYSYHFLAAITVASFLLLASFSLLVLKDFANSGDEYGYIFQAKTFLQGRFYNNTHPLQEFFNLNHIFAREEKWFSRFPPGWPIVLMMGNLMKIPMGLINPLIGALSVLVFFLLVKRLYNENIAIVSCLSLILSSFFIFNSASYFSHNLCGLLILLFAYFSILYDENDRVIYILLAGGSIGFAFITRYYTALLCAVPIILYILSRKKSKCFSYFFYCAIGAAPLIAFHMFYNYRITGNPFLLVTQWVVPTETIGFVRGHNLFKGLWYVCLRLIEFIEWTSPFMIFLYIGGLFFAVRKKNAFYFDLMLVFLVFGYMFFYATGGNAYGPRYYYEAYPFVIMAVVSNLDLALKDKVLRDFLVVLFSVGFFVGVGFIPSIAVFSQKWCFT